jgi:hypothetical protein
MRGDGEFDGGDGNEVRPIGGWILRERPRAGSPSVINNDKGSGDLFQER